MHNHYLTGKERRQYIRLDTVIPVLLRLETPDGKKILSDWLQGFSSDISRGGMCLTVNKLSHELSGLIKERKVRLALEIDIPFRKQPVIAKAEAAWIRDAHDIPNKYIIGISYAEIDWKHNNLLFWYALGKKLFLPVAFGVIAILFAAFMFNNSINEGLTRTNKDLIERLMNTVRESGIARDKLEKITKDREDLQSQINSLQSRIKEAEAKKEDLSKNEKVIGDLVNSKLAELNSMVEKLNQERMSLREKLGMLETEEGAAKAQLKNLDKKKAVLEEANFHKMYKWLTVHQSPRTGLVASFEGDGDIRDWAFIYDQSLATQAYVNGSDLARARKNLNFFLRKAQRKGELFYNAYYATDGQPAEFTVHTGPNIWLGIAALQYTNKAQDVSYLDLAVEIAKGILKLQDKEGGIVGGPDAKWYSTEHNLDAYAFFNMLYKVTEDEQYRNAADKVLRWLALNTYNRPDLPIKRGKGDSTIATDTYAWSIAAIGPEKLISLGMDPVKIIEFAEQSCSVEAEFLRPEGPVEVRGFDFAPARHVARGGVISSEWTAQMVMAYRIMADYFSRENDPKTAQGYQQKANEYLAELSKMVISSASPSGQGEGCLPYATQEYVDTGHGWYTPKGKATGSVAGTAYTLFAYYNYNPLELRE